MSPAGSNTVPRFEPASAPLHAWRPRFRDESNEAAYREHHVQHVLRPHANRSLLVGAVFFALSGIADFVTLPDPSIAFIPRFFVGLPLMLAAWLTTFTTLFRRGSQAILLAYGLAASLSTVLIASRVPAEPSVLYAGWLAIFVALAPLVARLSVSSQLTYVALSSVAMLHFEWGHLGIDPVVHYGLLWAMVSVGIYGAALAALHAREDRRTFWAARLIASQSTQLALAQQRSEALLANVLPGPISERLKAGETVIADAHRDVTVLFADIVGFTQISAELHPAEMVSRLNTIFSAFDDLCERFGLEKIKTIGDAYMAAGGVPSPRADHAADVVRMALAMQHVITDLTRAWGKPLQLRIGIHTGPLVAGVIGKQKFAYDAWGDTVNVASRMESLCIDGEIQISEATASRLGDAFMLEPRGTIAVKGRGRMRAWFVHGEKTDELADPTWMQQITEEVPRGQLRAFAAEVWTNPGKTNPGISRAALDLTNPGINTNPDAITTPGILVNDEAATTPGIDINEDIVTTPSRDLEDDTITRPRLRPVRVNHGP